MILFMVSGNPRLENHPLHKFYTCLTELSEVLPVKPQFVKDAEVQTYERVISFGYTPALQACENPLVITPGYFSPWSLHNPGGQFTLGFGGPQALPDGELNALRGGGLVKRQRYKKKPILIYGQDYRTPYLKAPQTLLTTWYEKAIGEANRQRPRNSLWFRNSLSLPIKERIKFQGVDLAEAESLSHYIDMCSGLVCYNDGSAVQAIKQGIPVYCHESAFYYDVCQGLEDLQPYEYDPGPTQVLLNQVDYTQWSDDELGDPNTLLDILQMWMTGDVPEGWKAEVVPPPPTQQEFDLAVQIMETKNFFKARSLAKQYWRDRIFNNQSDIDRLCNHIIKEFKSGLATNLGMSNGHSG